MKRPQIRPESINEVADSITRSSSEHEDIDLGAEATDSAPAKTLQSGPSSKRGRPNPVPKRKR